MKFGELLNAQLLSEWRAQYFQYEVGKKMLYHYKENAPSSDEEHPSDFVNSLAHFERTFFEFTKRELTKINTFYLEKLNEARRKFVTLNSELDEWLKYKRELKDTHQKPAFFHKILSKSKDSHDFKVAYREFYYNIILLQNYQQLNLTAFRKILKKHDKILATTDGQKWREKTILTADFATIKAAEELTSECERIVTEKLQNGDHKRAMKMLRVQPIDQRPYSQWAVFRIGFMFGYILILAFFISLSIGWFNCQTGTRGCWRRRVFLENSTNDALAEDGDTFWLITIRLYRGVFLVGLLIILFGINMHGWRIAGINHILLFEIDPRESGSSIAFIELGFIIMTTCAMSVLIWLAQFYISFLAKVPLFAVRCFSMSYVALLVLIVVNPLPIFMYKTRFWLLKSLFRIFTAPFHSVRFADYFLASQLCSIVIVFQDYAFVTCCGIFRFEASDVQSVCNRQISFLYGLLASLPYWFRFAQCVRSFRDRTGRRRFYDLNLLNAAKYSAAFALVIFRSLIVYWNPGNSNIKTTSAKESTILSSLNDTLLTGDGDDDADSLNPPNPFHLTALFLSIVTLIYWFFWDTKVDWQLWDTKHDSNNRFLRDQLAYHHTWYYYICIVVDFILLTNYWTVQVVDTRLTSQQSYQAELLLTVIAFCEVFRRFVWNFLRLECEHITNPGKANSQTHSNILHHYSMKPLLNLEMDEIDVMMKLEDGINAVRNGKRAKRNSLS